MWQASGDPVAHAAQLPARSAHGRGYQVAAREAVAVALDDAEELVAEHQPRRGPSGATPKTPSEISRSVPQTPTSSVRRRTSPSAGCGSGTSATAVLCGWPGMVDEAEHGQAAVSPPSMTKAVPVTNAASSEAR